MFTVTCTLKPFKILCCKLYQSTENGEKAKKEAEAEPEEKQAEEEKATVKSKTKKEKQSAGEGFELWNELEVQRIKFMVRFEILLTEFYL